MPSPFPGMDPFIEGSHWEGFHTQFMTELQRALVPLVRPKYVALLGERIYLEHCPPGPRRSVLPDVSVTTPGGPPRRDAGTVGVLEPPVRVPVTMPERIVERYLEVRHRTSGELVTAIEVLSPTNKLKGADGRREYLAKREALLLSQAHLVELDLLRGGARLPMERPLPPADYYALVSRAEIRPDVDVWPTGLRQPLPLIPIPLLAPDPDARLDLQKLFTRVYEAAGYDYTLDYAADPEPSLGPGDAAWARELLDAALQGAPHEGGP